MHLVRSSETHLSLPKASNRSTHSQSASSPPWDHLATEAEERCPMDATAEWKSAKDDSASAVVSIGAGQRGRRV